MTQITLPAELSEKLKAAGDFAKLVDESGNVLGTFHRELTPPYDPKLIPPPLDPAEIKRRTAGPGLTTEDVIRHLRNR